MVRASEQSSDVNLEFLVERLSDSKESKRLYAVTFLATLGEQAQPVLEHLLQSLKDPSPDVRRMVVIALTEIGGDPALLIPHLLPMLEDTEPSVVRRTILLLGSLGSQARPAVSTLLALMNDPRPLIRRHVTLALGDIGSTARTVLGILIDCMGEKDVKNRVVASAALLKMGPRITPRLIRELDHQNPEVRRRLVRLLGKHPRGAEALPELYEMLDEEDNGNVREAIVDALSVLDPSYVNSAVTSEQDLSSGEVRAIVDEVLFTEDA